MSRFKRNTGPKPGQRRSERVRDATKKQPAREPPPSPPPPPKKKPSVPKKPKEGPKPIFLQAYEFWYPRPENFDAPPGWRSAPVMQYSFRKDPLTGKSDIDDFTPKIRLAEEAGYDLKCGMVLFDPKDKWVVTDELFDSFYGIPNFGAQYEVYERFNSNAKYPSHLLCVKRTDYQDPETREYSISLEKYVEESDRLRRIHQTAPIPSRLWEAKFMEKAADRMPHVFYGSDLEIRFPNPFSNFLKTVPYGGWLKRVVSGLTSFYSYIGMPYTTFALHVEDLMAYSINMHLFGEPKIWISVDPSYTTIFEACLRRDFASRMKNLSCEEFLQHKDIFISPDYLRENNIPFYITPQYPGQIVVTFPRGYHWGWNQGLCINIAANLVMEKWFYYWRRWIKEGIFRSCTCPVRNPEYLKFRIPAAKDLNATYCRRVYENLVSTRKTPTMPGSYEIPEWMLQRHRKSLRDHLLPEESEDDQQPGTSSGLRLPIEEFRRLQALKISTSIVSPTVSPATSPQIAPGRGRKSQMGGKYVCKCGKSFDRIDSFSRHKKSHDEPDKFLCKNTPLGCRHSAPRVDQIRSHENNCLFN